MFRHWDILICADQRCALLFSSHQRTSGVLSSLQNLWAAVTGFSDCTWFLKTFSAIKTKCRMSNFTHLLTKMKWCINWLSPGTVGIRSVEESEGWNTEIYINPNTLLTTQHKLTMMKTLMSVINTQYQPLSLTSIDRELANDMMKYSVNKWVSSDQ